MNSTTPAPTGEVPRTTARTADWRLPLHPRSAGLARVLLRKQAAAWAVRPGRTETAVLLLSELVSNACEHARDPAGQPVRARCALNGGTLRVEVSDASGHAPQPRNAAPEDESGRGLCLLAALADDWGSQPRPSGRGKTVWFELGTGEEG